jgi:hypothetical protein
MHGCTAQYYGKDRLSIVSSANYYLFANASYVHVGWFFDEHQQIASLAWTGWGCQPSMTLRHNFI